MTIDITKRDGEFALDHFKNGSLYELSEPTYEPAGSGKYSDVAILEDVVIKRPTSYGFSEYKRYVKVGRTDSDELRPLEEIERYSNAEHLLARYPEFTDTWAFRPVETHYLLVFRLQLDRLALEAPIEVPAARFILASKFFLDFLGSGNR